MTTGPVGWGAGACKIDGENVCDMYNTNVDSIMHIISSLVPRLSRMKEGGEPGTFYHVSDVTGAVVRTYTHRA